MRYGYKSIALPCSPPPRVAFHVGVPCEKNLISAGPSSVKPTKAVRTAREIGSGTKTKHDQTKFSSTSALAYPPDSEFHRGFLKQ
ncbi:hypothetical protein C8035_v005278 [Colletotrichum spinosum]|uniref:Uncharacterized protein n=1 Tax=Colletotrichum spinosum TaxID=1347390 RepID=A0A4R8Q3F6_9PEZI|nr:hypothetical protein C8035_v005278 [Colletotrichum spinosum]